MLDRPTPDSQATAGTVDRDERLGEAIEAYLAKAEASGPTDPEEFARGYPDLGDDLVAALEGLALVQGLVGEANGPGRRLEEGRRIAGYRIVRELGRGGMGIVYEALHVGLDRPVALKVLGTQAAPDSSGRRRFLNEAKTAAGLHHTHIVPVFDVGQVGGLCYYAMQRIEGSGLDRVLRILRRDRSIAAGSSVGSGSKKSPTPPGLKVGPRPGLDDAPALSGLGDETRSWRAGVVGGVAGGGGSAWRGPDPDDEPPPYVPPRGSAYYRWVAEVGRQAADALAHAHQRGIIHRDIKPSNLLVDARGVIWVADFGLARRLADPSQTQFDSLLGTPRYMSPEQARPGAIDGRADVYSLGATLYELITLRPPFDGQSAAELIDQIKTKEPHRPRKFDPRVPLDLETILLKALAKRPDDRYANADALAEDLARFLAHEPVKARRIGPIGRAVRFARRHPSLTAVSTTAAVVVLSTATFAYVRVLDARDRADESADIAKRAQRDTEKANGQLAKAAGELKATMLTLLEKTAANIQVSSEPDRRSKGLESLARAARLGPDPATVVKLRDRALAFLSLRDVEAGPPIETPTRPHHGLVFGGSGKRVASLSDRGELGVWDVAGREQVDATESPIAPSRGRPQNGRGGGGGRPRPSDLRLAPAGDQVAVILPDGSGVGFHDLASPGVPAETLVTKGHQVVGLLASTDGRRLLTIARPEAAGANRPGPPDRLAPPEEPRIALWDRDHPDGPRASLTPPAPKLDPTMPRDRPGSLLLAIAPDGSRVAVARQFETEVALWDGEGRPLPSIPIGVNATTLALGPAGLLAVAGNGGEVALWDLSQAMPKRLPSLALHQSFVTLLRFSPRDGSILAATGMGGGVELWDLTTHAVLATLPTRGWVHDLAFSPDGQTLAAGQDTGVALWSVVEPVAQHVLPETGDTPRGLAFGPGDVLAIASAEANQAPSPLRLWGGPGKCPVSLREWDRVRPSSIGFDARGRLIATEPDAIRWFQPPAPEPVARIMLQPPGFARLAARSADGRFLVVVRPNGYALWSEARPDALEPIATPEPIQGYFPRMPVVAVAPDGSKLYFLGRRGESLNTQPLSAEAGPTVRVPDPVAVSQATSLAISPDGRTLAVAERSGAIRLIDAERGKLRATLPPTADDAGPADSLVFSPDGRTLAAGGRDQVRLWAIDGQPRPLVRLPSPRGSVRHLAFDSEGSRLATAEEKTVRVWDLAPLRVELARLGLNW